MIQSIDDIQKIQNIGTSKFDLSLFFIIIWMGGLTSLTFNEQGENHELNIIHGITRAITFLLKITFLIPKLIMDVPLHLSTNYALIFFLQSYFWKFIIHKNTNFLDIDSCYIEEEKKIQELKILVHFSFSSP